MTEPKRHRGVFEVFDPEATKRALDEVCAEAGVDVLPHTFVMGADREDNAVARVGASFPVGPDGKAAEVTIGGI